MIAEYQLGPSPEDLLRKDLLSKKSDFELMKSSEMPTIQQKEGF